MSVSVCVCVWVLFLTGERARELDSLSYSGYIPGEMTEWMLTGILGNFFFEDFSGDSSSLVASRENKRDEKESPNYYCIIYGPYYNY